MNTADFNTYDSGQYKLFCSRANVVRDLEHLLGLLEGVECDKEINPGELSGLYDWLHKDSDMHRHEPFLSIKQVIGEALSDNYLSTDEYEAIIWLCNQYLNDNGYLNATKSAIREMFGIIAGIALDNHINDKEVNFLDNWLEENAQLKTYWPYDELYTVVTKILRDKVITPDERAELLAFCKSMDRGNTDNSALFASVKRGYFHIDPEIIIPERNFCITGISAKMKRKEIAEKIELYGGFVQKNVTQDLHYLVVCDEKNSCWAFTCYGHKVEKAIRFRQQNKPITIVHERDLFDTFQNYNS